MKYKMLCVDMDGTCLDDNKEISEENLKAFKKAAERGVKVVVCTGRLYTSANIYAELIGLKVPVIASNGAYIREKDNDKVIFKAPLLYENCIKVLQVIRKYDIYPHFQSTDAVFYERLIYSSKIYNEANNTLPDDKKVKITKVTNWEDTLKKEENNILKSIAMDKDIEKINRLREEMKNIKGIEVVQSKYDNVEIMREGISKGSAVAVLSKFYNIEKEEIICIGDNDNDISMIKYAGLGVAMENGEDSLKKEADYITASNNNSGVAKVIEKFILI